MNLNINLNPHIDHTTSMVDINRHAISMSMIVAPAGFVLGAIVAILAEQSGNDIATISTIIAWGTIFIFPMSWLLSFTLLRVTLFAKYRLAKAEAEAK